MAKCDFNKVIKQLYWNHTSAWVFSCKFATYFQNTSKGLLLFLTSSTFHFLAYIVFEITEITFLISSVNISYYYHCEFNIPKKVLMSYFVFVNFKSVITVTIQSSSFLFYNTHFRKKSCFDSTSKNCLFPVRG